MIKMNINNHGTPPATDLHLDEVLRLPTMRDIEALMEWYQWQWTIRRTMFLRFCLGNSGSSLGGSCGQGIAATTMWGRAAMSLA